MPTVVSPLLTSLASPTDFGDGLKQVGESRGARSSPVGVKSGVTDFATYLAPSSAQRVEPRRTPLSREEASNAIAKAFERLTGKPLDEGAKAILTAQWAHETGHGASMYNYNFGGIKGVGPSGLTVAQKTREGYGKTETRIVDQFRAYRTSEEGAEDYARLLLNRYGKAVESAQAGDVQGFVQGLRQRGYFTGDPAAYERSIARLSGEFSTGEGARGEVQLGAPADAPARVDLALTTSTSSDVAHRALLSQLQGLMSPPMPTALLQSDDASTADAYSDSSFDSMSRLRALSMADELARSALEIAKDESRSPKDASDVLNGKA